MANYNVVKRPSGEWAVKRDGSSKVSSYADTQKEAEKDAKRYSSNTGGGEVRIHGRDGKIRDSDTVPPGGDPNPPKDKKH